VKRGITEQAKQLKNKAAPEIVEQFEKQYEHSLAIIDKVGHQMAYDTALLFIKDTEANTSEPISCKAGCGFCCHQPVFVSYPEFQNIKTHLLATGRKIEKSKLELQKNDVVDNVYTKLRVLDRRCVFLGDNMSCSIYEVRPLLCRRHNVYSDPQHCASGSKSEMRFDVNPRTEGHLSAYLAYYKGDLFHEQMLKEPELLK
jgi:Fe-S-cluster containining protein